MAPPRPHALYRFYGQDDSLLYVGITCSPGSRWSQHSDEKPWWHEVARITVAQYPGRQEALDAERSAIQAERPRYNVQHNNGTSAKTEPEKEPAHACPTEPFNVGDVVALGLPNGQCPVGLIAAMDEVFIRLDLMSWWDGTFGLSTRVVRISEVSEAMVAREQSPEEVAASRWGEEVSQKRVESISKNRWFDTDPLGTFQTEWKRRWQQAQLVGPR